MCFFEVEICCSLVGSGHIQNKGKIVESTLCNRHCAWKQHGHTGKCNNHFCWKILQIFAEWHTFQLAPWATEGTSNSDGIANLWNPAKAWRCSWSTPNTDTPRGKLLPQKNVHKNYPFLKVCEFMRKPGAQQYTSYDAVTAFWKTNTQWLTAENDDTTTYKVRIVSCQKIL